MTGDIPNAADHVVDEQHEEGTGQEGKSASSGAERKKMAVHARQTGERGQCHPPKARKEERPANAQAGRRGKSDACHPLLIRVQIPEPRSAGAQQAGLGDGPSQQV